MAATKVFSLGGQSNMDGWALTSEMPAPYNVPQPDVKYWNDNGWADLQGGFGQSSSSFGPEVSFGSSLHAMFPNDSIYLVKYAAGGTALADPAGQWTPNGSGWVYNNFKSTADAALQNLRNAGLSPSIAGMAWMQGESDAVNPSYAPTYATNLTNFVGKVRNDFATPDMPFVVGRIMSYSQYPFGTPTDNALVRTAQTTVPTQVANVSWVDTDSLPVYPYPNGPVNPGHYTAQGQIGLGTLFADKFGPTPNPGTPLLTNGSFEQSSLVPNSTFTNGLFTQTNNGDITGWTSQNGGYWYFNNGGTMGSLQFGDAQDGVRFVNLATNNPSLDPISQSFPVTANTTYSVRYWLGMRGDNGGSPDTITSAVTLAAGSGNGTLSVSTPSSALSNISTFANPVTGWKQFSYSFTPSTNTVATLTFSSAGGSGYGCLDNVSVMATAAQTLGDLNSFAGQPGLLRRRP